MPRLTFFDLPNDEGQDLLDKWVRPVCQRRGIELVCAPPDADRGTAILSQALSRFVLWDCSVEGPRRAYRALTMWAKLKQNNLLVSRTPLPRNVLALHQCAPIHGHKLSNVALAEWLDRYLFTELTGGTLGHRANQPGVDGGRPGHVIVWCRCCQTAFRCYRVMSQTTVVN